MGYCCDMMKDSVEETCDIHPNRWDCPKLLITLADDGDYGLTIYGSSAIQVIDYCPWCGSDLKKFASLRL